MILYLESSGLLSVYLREVGCHDAVHLATALVVSDSSGEELLISTWDRDLALAAEAEGLSLAHEVTT